MSSPARRIRRAQERQMVKQIRKAQRAEAQPEPDRAERSAERLQAMGISHARSMLWTPQG